MMPSIIGRYEVERAIGAGAMAMVYLARDPYMTRRVAVKVMAPHLLADPEFAVRFRREAQVIATLEHAYIVPVYDFGQDATGGQPFIVMRYMAAGTLQKYLAPEPLPVSDAVHILERICEALDDAHERGIIHRDLKPGNILLDKYGQAYLADFGLARIATGDQDSLGQKYRVGTPAYMSPEQIMNGELSSRSDVYSLGVILFELLAGQRPFRDDNDLRLLLKHVAESVPDILRLNPALPPAVGGIIQRAMAKSPADRFASAGEMAAALTEAARGIPSRRARKRWMTGELDAKLVELDSERRQ